MRPGRAKGAMGAREARESQAERPPGARPAYTLCQVARERCDDYQEIATFNWSLERRTSRKLEAMKCSQGKQLGRAAKSSQEQFEVASISGSDEWQQ
ncbi:hypothetical protein HaLaN_29682, partial [Haematococcus lacustris]